MPKQLNYSQYDKQAYVADFKKSGLSRKNYCSTQRISEASLNRWLKDFEVSNRLPLIKNKTTGFSSVKIKDTAIVESNIPLNSFNAADIKLSNGITICLSYNEAHSLFELIKMLQEV